MANPTTNYGFVLPEPTSLVTDLPADFDVALQGVDTRLKALQPGTTAGDLVYASSTANTNVRLGIGTTNQVLSVVAGVPAWAAATITDISCRVYQSTTTNLSTTFASIAFGAENFDTDTMHDNSTNNSRITIKTAGKFNVGGQASTSTNAALGVRILLNGTTVISRVFQGNSGATEGANVSTIYDFALNDFIELQAALGSGTGTTSGDGTLQNFWAVKL